jgi:hypothetical protein
MGFFVRRQWIVAVRRRRCRWLKHQRDDDENEADLSASIGETKTTRAGDSEAAILMV